VVADLEEMNGINGLNELFLQFSNKKSHPEITS
jgi:hypothetical protein